jgi:chemotaxis protein methyltransferase CheR
VTFEFAQADWKLTVADNGAGRNPAAATGSSGLGTAIVAALAKQLKAQIHEVSSASGLRVEVTHATFASHLPVAA